MNKELTLAQMQKIREESMMENTYEKTTNKAKMGKGKMAIGAIWVQEGQDGWKVMKGVPEKASFRELYNLATPNTPMGG